MPSSAELVGRRRFDERGSAELVVATPLLLLLILVVIQFALFEHASQVAQTAAAEALASTRTDGATTSSGQTEAQVILHAVGARRASQPSCLGHPHAPRWPR